MVNLFGPRPPRTRENFDEMLARLEAEVGITPEPAKAASANSTDGSGTSTAGHEYQTPGPPGSSAFDRLAELASWADILERAGWIQVQPGDSATLEAWRRPGGTHPVSAKVLKDAPYALVVWSEDAGLPAGPGQNLTKARVLAHLHYGGDESALAKALVRGQAKGVPPHVNEAFRAVWREPTVVPPVTVLTEGPELQEEWTRWVDLRPYLQEGVRVRPQPDVGAERDDGIQLLYPRRWHTNIALTGAGKTAFALWHAKAVLDAGGHVVYLHFEEFEPDGVIDRLISFDVSREVIDQRFHFADCSRRWVAGEMAHWLTQFEEAPALAILDGINAACSLHGWKHGEPEAIGFYRAMFVTPLVKVGAAVLSLGHPPKARDRQNEMHGFGSTAWLDEVDGIGFRMVASKEHPMVVGGKGFSALYVVKDRYSQVKSWGNLDISKEQAWYYMGAFIVDDTPAAEDAARLNVPPLASGISQQQQTRQSTLADKVEECLSNRDGSFKSRNHLKALLAEAGVKFTLADLPVACEILVERGRLHWPEVDADNKARPGRLVDLEGGSE
jgi:hypothetical protein